MFPMLPPRVVTPALGAVAGSTVGISTPEITPGVGVGTGVPPRFVPILNEPIVGAAGAGDTMKWQVVKVYTMPDRQRAVKIMRIA